MSDYMDAMTFKQAKTLITEMTAMLTMRQLSEAFHAADLEPQVTFVPRGSGPVDGACKAHPDAE